MTDKIARAGVEDAKIAVASVHKRINEFADAILANSKRRDAAIAALDHKFNLLMEYLNTHEVRYPEVPAHSKIEKVKK